MDKESVEMFSDIKQMLQLILENQQDIRDSLKEIREEQKKLEQEIHLSSMVLSNMVPRSDVVN